MSVSLLKRKKKREKVVNPYYSLVRLISMIFQWCTKLKHPWVLLSQHISDFFQNVVCLDNRCAWLKTSGEGLRCTANITLWPLETAAILNYPQGQTATHKWNNSCLHLLQAQVIRDPPFVKMAVINATPL